MEFTGALARLEDTLAALRPSEGIARVLITGSRTWVDALVIEEALDRCNARFQRICVVHGDNKNGADAMADAHAKARGWMRDPRPAHWKVHGPDCPTTGPHMHKGYCPRAGHRRNAQMVDAGAVLCLAFIRDESSGATGCASLARGAKIATIVFTSTSESGLTDSLQLSLLSPSA